MSPARSVATDPVVGDQISTASGTTLRVVGISSRTVTVRDADGYPHTLTAQEWARWVKAGAVLPPPEAP
jgi:hypothetical protein